MDGYMTIGEVAKVKQISIKALRYYEKIGILKPAYCDPDTGYRYYKNEQMLAIAERQKANRKLRKSEDNTHDQTDH